MEELLLPVRAAWLRAWRGGRQVRHLLLQEMRMDLSVRLRVHPVGHAVVGRLDSLLLLGSRGSNRQIMKRCVNWRGGIMLYLLLLMMMMMDLHGIVLMIQPRVQELEQWAAVVMMEAMLLKL